jgi:hypothetical protein
MNEFSIIDIPPLLMLGHNGVTLRSSVGLGPWANFILDILQT